MRQLKQASAVLQLMELLQAMVERRVHADALPELAQGLRYLADLLAAPPVRH